MEHLQKSSEDLIKENAHMGAEGLDNEYRETSVNLEPVFHPSVVPNSYEQRVQRIEARLADIEKSEELRRRQTENYTENDRIPPVTRVQTTQNAEMHFTAETPSPDRDSDGNIKVRYERCKQTAQGGKYTNCTRIQGPLGNDAEQDILDQDMGHRGCDLVFTEHYNMVGKRDVVGVAIYADELRQLIRAVMQPLLQHERSKVWEKGPVFTQTRHLYVLYSWDALHEAAQSDSERQGCTKRAQELLRRFLHDVQVYEPEILEARETAYNQGQVHYKNVRILFPPACEVIASPFPGGRQIFILQNTVYRVLEKKTFAIMCRGYDWNGEKVVTNTYEFVIPEYEGTRAVCELACYPISFHRFAPDYPGDDDRKLRDALAERGKKFLEYSRHSGPRPKLLCNGFYSFLPPHSRSARLPLAAFDETTFAPTISVIDDRSHKEIVVDALLYRKYAPGARLYGMPLGQKHPKPVVLNPCLCILCRPRQSNSLDDIPHAHLPPRVLGYSLEEKTWGQIHVDHISKAPIQDSLGGYIWDSLSMSDKDKRCIRMMVKNHLDHKRDDSNRIRDLVPAKGEGLVFLLHGVPGVGKTMTAEALSAESNRRLLKIDAAEFIYNDPAQVSEVFQKYFDCSDAWGALLLLDEADVFLQMRNPTELEQNALVAVLLRQLEYFRGVLILTTNRIKTIDNAVQSRIHYAVHFRKLNPVGITKICKTFLDQLNDGNCEEEEIEKIKTHLGDEDVQTDLEGQGFTGRDIRNIFTTAQMLTYPMLSLDSLKQVIASTKKFRVGLRDDNIAREKAANIK